MAREEKGEASPGIASAGSTEDGGDESHARSPGSVLLDACDGPEIGQLLRGHAVRLDPTASAPVSSDGNAVLVHPRVTTDPAETMFLLRRELERGELQSRFPEATSAEGLAIDAIATVVAILYVDVCQDLQSPPSAVDVRTRELVREFGRAIPGVNGSLLRQLAEASVDLACKSGRVVMGQDCRRSAVEMVIAALPAAAPTELLMAAGGDDRQSVDWTTQESRYGVSPFPRPWVVPLASCTASSPTSSAFAASIEARVTLVTSALRGRLTTDLESRWSKLRESLLDALGIDTDAPALVVPMPSGTDAESLALAVSLAAGASVTSIVIAPGEVGSGTLEAAAGRYFSGTTPTGRGGGPANELPGRARDVSLVAVEVRDAHGGLRPQGEVEDEIAGAIETAISSGRRVLLHHLDGSKTGVRLPSDEATVRWSVAYAPNVDVVVDAAQLRVDQQAIARHLSAGSMAIVTASKFYGGPPFSGALLVPRSLGDRLRDSSKCLNLDAYLDRYAIPENLQVLRDSAVENPNIGLFLRWTAGCHEMQSFMSISPALRDEIISTLASQVLAMVGDSSTMRIVHSPYTATDIFGGRDLDDLPTIFTFQVERDGRYLSRDELMQLQDLLRHPVRSVLGDLESDSRSVLTKSVELGQPVNLGPLGRGGAALRIALGAPMLSRIAFDRSRGARWRHRLDNELRDIQDGLRKLEILVEKGFHRFRRLHT